MADQIRQEPPATLGEAWSRGAQMGHDLNTAKNQLREVVAHRVKVQRLNAKMTQEELANRININFLTYRGYENCKSDIPLVLLVRIANEFGVSLDYLAGRTDETDPEQYEPVDMANVKQRISDIEKHLQIMQAMLDKK